MSPAIPGADGPADGDAAAPVAYRTVPYVRAEQVKRLEKAKRDLAALARSTRWRPRSTRRWRPATGT